MVDINYQFEFFELFDLDHQHEPSKESLKSILNIFANLKNDFLISVKNVLL